jgi:uncharacterized protein YbaR (Trm112 family)/SAM-dependent methyltransferase
VVVRVSSVFTCPACQAPLEPDVRETGSAFSCPSCARTYPKLGDIPLLLPDALGTLELWRSRLSAFVGETQAIERHLWAELLEPKLTDATRQRLRAVAEAMPHHRALVLELFHEIGLEPGSQPMASEPGSILDFVTLVFRDFAWAPEIDEVTPAFARLEAILPPDLRLGKTLIFGAGTARIAWDLNQRIDPSAELLALDTNPLPFLVTQRLLQGHDASLYELPGHPRRAEDAAVRRALRPPYAAPPRLQLVFADGLRAPVRSGAFDTVVTPWFVDQVPSDLAQFLPEISRVLRAGGTWLHAGPFVYDPGRTKPAHRYSREEFLELAYAAGFAVTACDYAPAPHLCSPLSTQGRQEWVLSLHATKASGPPDTSEPEWLAAGAVPRLDVPPGTEWPLPILERVLEAIDGRRSVQDITRTLLDRDELADDGNAEVVVRGCLRVIYKTVR